MARRMFSDKIVDTDAFLDMGQGSQLLYFHLSMRADDDGFVANPKKVMRMIGSQEDDYKVLLAKRFIIQFQSGVCVIKHWLIHNLIRSDRYTKTQWIKERGQLIIDPETKKYTLNKGENDVIPNGNQMATQDRLELGKVSKDIVADATREFSFEEEMGKLRTGSRKDYKIIALYWKKKNWVFENMEQFNAALVRELKPAKQLKGYTGEQIARSIQYCEEKYPEIWTLETVHKRITDLINKK